MFRGGCFTTNACFVLHRLRWPSTASSRATATPARLTIAGSANAGTGPDRAAVAAFGEQAVVLHEAVLPFSTWCHRELLPVERSLRRHRMPRYNLAGPTWLQTLQCNHDLTDTVPKGASVKVQRSKAILPLRHQQRCGHGFAPIWRDDAEFLLKPDARIAPELAIAACPAG